MNEIYIAEFRYGSANLARVQVVKETPKTFRLSGGREVLLGTAPRKAYCRQINKSEVAWFESPGEAHSYLYEKAEKYTEKCRSELNSANEQMHKLARLIYPSEVK